MPREVTADPDANAYATTDDADTAAGRREAVVRAAWDALDDDQKEGALELASRDIDTLEDDPGFLGERADDDQERAWPRTGTDYSDDAWPQVLVDATLELAFSYAPAFVDGATTSVLNPSTADGNVSEETVGPITTKWFAPRTTEALGLARFPQAVQRLLVRLIVAESTSEWGSALVRRSS